MGFLRNMSNTTTILKAVVFDWVDREVQHIYDIQIEGESSKTRAKHVASIAHDVAREYLEPVMEDEPVEGKYLFRGKWVGWTDYWGEYDAEWEPKEVRLLRTYTEEEIFNMYGLIDE